jgi:lysophospholipase L1-like esterase
MLDCLILGDSIAVGTHRVMPSCAEYATGGYNSWQWNKKYSTADLGAKSVIISLGTNDHQYVKTRKELEAMRARVKADRVYWIMPPCNEKFCKPTVNEIVQQIAQARGDFIIATARVQPDRIHPSWAGYAELKQQIQKENPDAK